MYVFAKSCCFSRCNTTMFVTVTCPCNHTAPVQRCGNNRLTSETLDRHWVNVACLQAWLPVSAWPQYPVLPPHFYQRHHNQPVSLGGAPGDALTNYTDPLLPLPRLSGEHKTRLPHVGLMLVQRLRRWTSIEPTWFNVGWAWTYPNALHPLSLSLSVRSEAYTNHANRPVMIL